MNPEIIYWQKQIDHYEDQIRFCNKMADESKNQFPWEEKRVSCEAEKLKAEKMLGIIEVQNILKKVG